VVEHQAGRTEVPAPPQRIAYGTEGPELEELLALGAVPVLLGRRDPELRPTVVAAAGVDHYRVVDGLNIERIAAARPDLIVAHEGFASDVYDQLSRAAPTISVVTTHWRLSVRQVADALGRVAEGEDVIAGIDARIAEAAPRLAPVAGLSLAFAYIFPRRKLPGIGPDPGRCAGARAGAARAAAGRVHDHRAVGALSTDVLFVLSAGQGDAVDDFESGPLFRNLPSEAAGRYFRLEDRADGGGWRLDT